MEPIITRLWHGVTLEKKSDAYLDFLLNKGTSDYRSTPGIIGIHIWRTVNEHVAHFRTVTTWDSLNSVKKFTGGDHHRAIYYPEDKEFLLEFEPRVEHFETFVVK